MHFVHHAPNVLDRETPLAVFRYRLIDGDAFGPHDHVEHQLSWSPQGMVTAESDGVSWALPPTMAIWIPANVNHDVGAVGAMEFFNVKFRPEMCSIDLRRPTAVAVTPLLRALIERLADLDLEVAARRRIEAVLFDEIAPIASDRFTVQLPTDERAVTVARGLLANPRDGRSLDEWGDLVGASERTLVRLFAEQTGMTFSAWRTHIRIRAALVMLGQGRAIGAVARQVGYQDSSAFIVAFRRILGVTPGTFLRDAS